MKPYRREKFTIPGWRFPVLWGLAFLIIPSMVAGSTDPWTRLREKTKSVRALSVKPVPQKIDPWQQLRAVMVMFSATIDEAALTQPDAAKEVASHLHHRLAPYHALIKEASERFDIPMEIISAVIMVESGGNPAAKAKISSAKGLMQTIDATFQHARNGLKRTGVTITNDPFTPRASIMAGSWYLNQMYQAAIREHPEIKGDRAILENWRYPLEYYYAGPGYGKKREDIIIIYSDGRKRVINKPKYSRKVLHWAEVLKA